MHKFTTTGLHDQILSSWGIFRYHSSTRYHQSNALSDQYSWFLPSPNGGFADLWSRKSSYFLDVHRQALTGSNSYPSVQKIPRQKPTSSFVTIRVSPPPSTEDWIVHAAYLMHCKWFFWWRVFRTRTKAFQLHSGNITGVCLPSLPCLNNRNTNSSLE